MVNRLMLLAGSTRRDGWKTLDAKGGDYLATIPPLPEDVRRIQWDEIELVHGITQFYPWDSETVLREIRSVMAPDGLLILEQPDILLKMSYRRVDWIYGDPLWKDPAHMVKWGYSPMSLSSLLTECGFSRQEVKPAQYHVPARDFRIEARP